MKLVLSFDTIYHHSSRSIILRSLQSKLNKLFAVILILMKKVLLRSFQRISKQGKRGFDEEIQKRTQNYLKKSSSTRSLSVNQKLSPKVRNTKLGDRSKKVALTPMDGRLASIKAAVPICSDDKKTVIFPIWIKEMKASPPVTWSVANRLSEQDGEGFYESIIKINKSKNIFYSILMSALHKYLTQYLLQCNKLEHLAQSIRQSLAKNPYFQIVSAFERFDKFRKGYLEPADFSEFMLENQVYPTEGELYLIFKDFDKTKKGVVSLEEFEIQLLPRENRLLKKKVQQRLAYAVELKLELDLQFLLGKYFQDKINTIGILGELREKMKMIKPDAVDIVFGYIDIRKARYITSPTEIDNFLRSNGKVLKIEELERIYRALNFNQNREISELNFKEHLDPFWNGCYPAYQQKMVQKQSLQHRFLEKKYQVQNLRTKNRIENEQLQYQISELRSSNRRLREIMDEQDLMGYIQQKKWYPY